ncbi:Peptide chain release factor RF1 [Buchnera aphidicola (Eriosoma grossulariae)]|uniref:peptide chain release factor 1 n=1 Tax=Buchnera aphidicola TaxID=9 RepID=UPI0034642254
MKSSIVIKLETLIHRYKELELMLANSTIINNQDQFQLLSREYLDLSEISNCFIEWKQIINDIQTYQDLLKDCELATLAKKEIEIAKNKKLLLEKQLKILLLPQDPNDQLSCFIEIRAATGGDEAAIFAGELFKMYARYSEFCHWNVDIVNVSLGEKGGYKEIIAKIQGKNVCGRLKFESGGHRVQRIPQTESQGRIHTSTCTVAIMPVVPDTKKIIINPSDLKIDTFRSSGAGGQHVNTTDSAIRITHIPTGYVVECQDERSQHKNKAKALSVLSSRIYSAEVANRHEKNSLIRKNLLGTGDRSDRNRTYNFPQNRVTDHRINLTLYSLNEILEGKLDILIDPIIQDYQASQFSSLSHVDKK